MLGTTALFLAWCLLWPAPSAQAASGDTPAARLAAILARRGTQPLEARFRQTKYVALLREPLSSEGRVRFEADGGMLWEVLVPEPLVIDTRGGVVRAGPPGDVREVPEAALGGLGSLPGGFSGVLGATAEEISAAFDVASGPSSGEFRLTPKTPELARALRSIDLTVDPTTGRPRRVVLRETGGDRSEIELTPLPAHGS